MKSNLTFKLLFSAMLFAYASQTNAQGKLEPMATGKYEPTWESLRQYNEARNGLKMPNSVFELIGGHSVNPSKGIGMLVLCISQVQPNTITT